MSYVLNIFIGLNKICELDLFEFNKFNNLNFRISIDFYTYDYEELNKINTKLKAYLDNSLEYFLLPLSSMRSKEYGKSFYTLLFDSTDIEEFKTNISDIAKNNTSNYKDEILDLICSLDKKKSFELSKIAEDNLFYQKVFEYIISKNKASLISKEIIK